MNQELFNRINEVFSYDIEKVVLSNGKIEEYKKYVITRKVNGFQVEKFTDKQAFHENIDEQFLRDYCISAMESGFKQFNAWNQGQEYEIKLSKKGKVFSSTRKSLTELKLNKTNNKKKSYYLEEGTIIPPLVDMGIFTKDGKIVVSMYDKYRQINKFIQFIDESIDKAGLKSVNIVDFGCGKSYLTFVVYYYLTFIKQIDVTMTGLDLKADVIAKCQETANKYGYDRLSFQVGDVAEYESE